MKSKCLKELNDKEVYEMIENVDERLVAQHEWGGRTHYYFMCDVCRKIHRYVGIEHRVVPNQPAIGWDY